MAKFDLEGFDDLISSLNMLEFEKMAPKMLDAAVPILERNIKSRALAHHRTGAMAGSIRKGSIRATSEGYRCTVRPTGTDSKGVRNMEKMVYLEYGTYKQTATPVLGPAVAESESSCLEKMQKVFDDFTKDIQL